MLLFVVEPQLDHGRDRRRTALRRPTRDNPPSPIDGRAIGVNLLERGPGDQPAPRAGKPVADGSCNRN